jgi:hypothetical protein
MVTGNAASDDGNRAGVKDAPKDKNASLYRSPYVQVKVIRVILLKSKRRLAKLIKKAYTHQQGTEF